MSTALVNDLSNIVRSAPAIFASRTCREALRVMFQHPESKCIVVCNATNEPLGLLMCDRFFKSHGKIRSRSVLQRTCHEAYEQDTTGL